MSEPSSSPTSGPAASNDPPPGWSEQAVALRQALEQNGLLVVYQPIISLNSGHLEGLEALVRWPHPQHGLLAPADFLPLADAVQLLPALDRWVLAQACRQVAEWQRRFHLSLFVSVNISGAQLAQPDFAQTVLAILTASGLTPTLLKLEVAEAAIISGAENAVRNLKQLHVLGVQLSIDDFGTGYASLNYLHRMPVANLKIDRSLISRIDVDQRSESLVQGLIALARSLNIEVTAEGVETATQLEHLRQHHCAYGQGFLFAQPLAPEDCSRWLHQAMLRTRRTVASELETAFPEQAYPAEAPETIERLPTVAGSYNDMHGMAQVPSATPPARDPMTGAWSRYAIQPFFEQTRNDAQRLQMPFAFVVLDIDHFKSINDAYGHTRGDAVLIEFARRLMNTARSADRIFRYGGDEFVAVLPATDRTQATAFISRLFDQVSHTPFEGAPPLSLTTSVGVAIFPADGSTYEELFETADQRNYQAKRAGRSRAVFDDAPPGGVVTLDGPSRLLDRDQTLYELHRFLDDLDGQARGILQMNGKPGAGLTRMLYEVGTAFTRRGYGLLKLQGTPALRKRVRGALAEALTEENAAALLDAASEHLAPMINDRLRQRRQRGLVILLDQPADIDPDSLAGVRALFDDPTLPCVVLVYGSFDTVHYEPLPREAPVYCRMILRPLTIEGLRTWLRHSLNRETPDPLLHWLYQQTGGLPGYIRRALAYLVNQGLLQPLSDALYASDLLQTSLRGHIERKPAGKSYNLPPVPGNFIGRERELKSPTISPTASSGLQSVRSVQASF